MSSCSGLGDERRRRPDRTSSAAPRYLCDATQQHDLSADHSRLWLTNLSRRPDPGGRDPSHGRWAVAAPSGPIMIRDIPDASRNGSCGVKPARRRRCPHRASLSCAPSTGPAPPGGNGGGSSAPRPRPRGREGGREGGRVGGREGGRERATHRERCSASRGSFRFQPDPDTSCGSGAPRKLRTNQASKNK